MNISPDQARELLDGATPGPWIEDESNILNHDGDPLLSDKLFGDPSWYNDRDLTLMTTAPDLAQTIAGMEWEYGLRQPRPEPHAEGELYTSWGYRLFAAKAAFAGLTDRGVECYIVRRLVGPVEVTE